jgi:hypothetical protein
MLFDERAGLAQARSGVGPGGVCSAAAMRCTGTNVVARSTIGVILLGSTTGASPMRDRATRQCSYALLMLDGSRKEFSAMDVGEALQIARTILPNGRSASLVENEVALAEVTCSRNGFCEVSPVHPPA